MKPQANTVQYGIILAFVAAVSMATIGVFSRITALPSLTVAFYRLLLGAGFMALWILWNKGTLRIANKDFFKVLMTGVFLAGFIVCYIEAMNRTTMANAILIVYLAPFLASLISLVFFSEAMSKAQFFSMAIALAGFILMQDLSQPSLFEQLNTGVVFAAGAMFFYACFIVGNRTFSGGASASIRTFWQLFCGAVVVLPLGFLSSTDLLVSLDMWGWLALIGLLPGFIAIYAAIASLEKLPTAVYGTITYAEPVSVIIFGWLLFSEALTLQQLMGAALILGAGIYQARHQAKLRN